MNAFNITLLIIGVWNIIMSCSMKTKNLQSSILFKVIPLFVGVFCIIYALMLSNIIVAIKL